jgi:hypothetical protein
VLLFFRPSVLLPFCQSFLMLPLLCFPSFFLQGTGHTNVIKLQTHVGGSVEVYTCMYTCIQTYKHTHIHTYIHTHIYTHIHPHTFIHIHTHACMHYFIHTCIHTYIHAYTHTHTHL